MNTLVKVLIGLVVGYLIGIALGAFTAGVLGFEDAARFVAIGCGLLGAILGPVLLAGRDLGGRRCRRGIEVASIPCDCAIARREWRTMQDVRSNDDLRDIMALAETRRGLFRRSLLGIAGIGLAGILVACGDDEDDEEPATSGNGAEDPGEEPGAGEETGIGDDEDDGTEESVSEEEGLGDEEDGD